MVERLDLQPGESELPSGGQLLWRQMTRWVWDEDKRQPKTHAFGPTDADQQKPSFSNGNNVTAQEARDWHQKEANSPSCAVWPVSTSDLDETELRAIDDSNVPLADDEKRAPGHVYLDYRGMDKAAERRNRALLLRAALKRAEVTTTDIGFVPLEVR